MSRDNVSRHRGAGRYVARQCRATRRVGPLVLATAGLLKIGKKWEAVESPAVLSELEEEERFRRSAVPADPHTLSDLGSLRRRTQDIGFEELQVNLFGKDTSVALPSDPRYQVYAGQIHLVAVAECQGTFLRKRVRLSIPPFPFVLASSGSFQTSGSLLLGALKPGLDVRGNWNEDDLSPAQVVANGVSSDALLLRGDALIVGNATTPGSVQQDPSVRFLRGGAAVGGAKAEKLPVVELSRYDPASRAGVQTLPEASYPTLKAVEGLSRRSGSVTFAHGLRLHGLRLNGLLYVDGDVVIESGGLTGSGALVCTGKVTIRGASDFVADSRCAVVAGGDVSVTGTGSESSYYQGLLYSAGSGGISVEGVTLLGAAVASGPSEARVALKDVRVVFDEKATRVKGGEVGFGDAYPRGGFPSLDPATGERAYLRLKPVVLPGPPPRTVAEPGPVDFAAVGIATLEVEHFELVDASGSPVAGVDSAFRGAATQIGFMNELIAAGKPDGPLTPGRQFEFDLNRFVKTADLLRIVWRD